MNLASVKKALDDLASRALKLQRRRVTRETYACFLYAQIVASGDGVFVLPDGQTVTTSDPAVMDHCVTLANKFMSVLEAFDG